MKEWQKKNFENISKNKDGLRMMLASGQFGINPAYIDAAICEALVSAADSLICSYDFKGGHWNFDDFRKKMDDLLFPYCGLFADLKDFYPFIGSSRLPVDCYVMYLNSFLRDFRLEHGFGSLPSKKGERG